MKKNWEFFSLTFRIPCYWNTKIITMLPSDILHKIYREGRREEGRESESQSQREWESQWEFERDRELEREIESGRVRAWEEGKTNSEIRRPRAQVKPPSTAVHAAWPEREGECVRERVWESVWEWERLRGRGREGLWEWEIDIVCVREKERKRVCAKERERGIYQESREIIVELAQTLYYYSSFFILPAGGSPLSAKMLVRPVYWITYIDCQMV